MTHPEADRLIELVRDRTSDPEALARIGEFPGPAIAALVPEEAARFENRPGEEGTAGLKLSIEFMPEEDPRRSVGRISSFQQAEELKQLRALAGAAPVGESDSSITAFDSAGATDADVLAAWILRQGGPGAA